MTENNLYIAQAERISRMEPLLESLVSSVKDLTKVLGDVQMGHHARLVRLEEVPTVVSQLQQQISETHDVVITTLAYQKGIMAAAVVWWTVVIAIATIYFT